jgi:AcrR family transcriptional regulator
LARVRITREARERLIVDGAVRFFAEVGFGGQTRELARQLGMSQSLLFKYFPTKGDLIDRVYQEVYLSRWNPYWEVLLANEKILLRERLLKFYREYARRIMDYHWIRIFLYAGLLGSEINKNYLDLLRTRIIYRICHAMPRESRLPKLSETSSASAIFSSFGPSKGASSISPSSDTFIAICRTRGLTASSRIASTPSSAVRLLSWGARLRRRRFKKPALESPVRLGN